MKNINKIIAVVLMLCIIFIFGCNLSELEERNYDYSFDTEGDSNVLPFGGITSGTIAIVNNDVIDYDEVKSIQQSLLMDGYQISIEDALEQAINQRLLEQEVKRLNITITPEEAEFEIQKQLSLQGLTLEDYKEQLELRGISYEEELIYIKEQISIRNYLEKLVSAESIEVSQEEAMQFYEIYKLQYPDETESFEELEEDIIITLQQQEQQSKINELIYDLKLNAEIEYK